jgi:putative tricarboxylic transport membrane protein
MAHNHESAQTGARTVVLDLVVAIGVFVIGAVVGYESYRLGSSWGPEGPQAGYFPFYIGLLICVCSAVVFAQSLVKLKTDRRIFVTLGQFKQVLVILLPSTAYVLGVQWIGIYVPSALFIGLFMRIAGKYSWLRSAIIGLGVSVSAFVLFEIWFKIPLPKGPLERLLGY